MSTARASRHQDRFCPRRIAAHAAFALVVFGGGLAQAQTTVPGGTIATDTTWTLAGSPYTVTGNVAVVGSNGPDGITTLTIQPGVQVRFNAGIQLQIGGTSAGSPGALVADGNAAGGPALIRFTSSNPTPAAGNWNGLLFRVGARPSLLRNARVEYGGGGGWAGVYVTTSAGTTITLDDIEVENNANNGIELAGAVNVALSGATIGSSALDDLAIGNNAQITGSITGCSLSSVRYAGNLSSVAWSGNGFTNWGARVSRIPGDDIGDFAADNTFAKVADARVEVLTDTIARDATWTVAMADRYVATASLAVAGSAGPDGITTLTLVPGIEIAVNDNFQFQVGGTSAGVPGALVADGDAAGGPAQILFTSSSPTPTQGSWNGLYFRAGARSSLLRNARVEFGGGGGWAGIYVSASAATTITLDGIEVEDNENNGVEVAGAAILALSDSTLGSNALDDVVLGNNAQITGSVTSCSITSVRYAGNLPAVTWSGNSFTSWGARASRIPGNDIIDFALDNSFAKVSEALVEVLGDTIAIDASWPVAMADAYVAVGNLVVNGTHGADGITTLTLEPGVEMRFNSALQLQIGGTTPGSPGALVADGNAAGGPAEIRFTSDEATPTAGSWLGLYFRPGARPSLLRGVRIDYAGGGGWAGIYLGQSAGNLVTLVAVTVTQSGHHGIFQSGPTAMGAVTVTGTAANAIRFNSDAVSLNGCNLDSGQDHDIYFDNVASLVGSIQNCSAIRSVHYSGDAPTVAWSGNAFVNWGARVSQIEPEVVGSLIASNSIALAPGARVELTGGTVATDASWTAAIGNPYVAIGTIDVQGTNGPDGVTTLAISPGLELRFNGFHQFQIGGTSVGTPGALLADGDAAGGPAEIRFTSSSPASAPGDWLGLYFRVGARPSLLRNVRVDYGGAGGWAGIYMNQATGHLVTLHDVTVTQSGHHGIFQDGPAAMTQITVSGTGGNAIRFSSDAVSLDGCALDGGEEHDIYFENVASVVGSIENCSAIHGVFYGGEVPSIAWTGNTFADWGSPVSRLEPDVVGRLIADNTIVLAPAARLELTHGTVASDADWTAAAGNPYDALGAIDVEGTSGPDGITTLTLGPGLELRFGAFQQFRIGGSGVPTPGALVADGNAAGGPARIRVTSSNETPGSGDWLGIYFRPGARPSLLRNVRVDYGGAGGWAGIYDDHATGTLTLDDVEVVHSGNTGLFLAGASVAVTGSLFEDNADFDVYLQNVSTITGSITDSTLGSLFYAGTLPELDWSGNTFPSWGARTSRVHPGAVGPLVGQNTFDAIPGALLEVHSGTLADDATWSAAAGPLVFLGNLTVQGASGPDGRTTLTLAPGTTVRFPAFGSFLVGGNSGSPGELTTLGGGALVNFGSSLAAPDAGAWEGVEVRETGRVSLADVQIRHASTALLVQGTVEQLERLIVNRCHVGLDLENATAAPTLGELTIRNTTTAVRSLGTTATIRSSNLEGTSWGVENLSAATHCIDARQNWWGSSDGPSGAPPASGCETNQATGTGAAITAGVRFGSFLTEPSDDLDGLDCDDGDGFNDPCSGGNTAGCDDNCCNVANPSQADLDGDGVGDACDGNPVLRVSSDPLDGADFSVIQDAVDAAFESGSTIEIFPGLGPYDEAVRLDREQVFRFVGLDEPSGDPVIVDGLAGPAFHVINKVGVAPTTLAKLTVRGAQGVRALVDTQIDGVLFDGAVLEALRLDGGVHVVRDSAFGPPFAIGADINSGAQLTLERSVLVGATDAGILAEGGATLLSSLVAGGSGGDGIRLGPSGSATVRYSTIAGNTGAGIDNAAGGTLVVSSSIVYGNAGGDLAVAACGAVAWSDVGTPDCSASNGNLSADPLLDLDYRPTVGSPCLDHGPSPATFTGIPPFDLDGDVRLRDYDGDGIATGDCGAYETANPALVPGEVENVRFTFDFRMEWDAEVSAVEYHVYRDALSNLGFGSFGLCADGLDLNRTDTVLDDFNEPAPGAVFIYLVTAEAANGREGTLGYSTPAERSNFPANRCP